MQWFLIFTNLADPNAIEVFVEPHIFAYSHKEILYHLPHYTYTGTQNELRINDSPKRAKPIRHDFYTQQKDYIEYILQNNVTHAV